MAETNARLDDQVAARPLAGVNVADLAVVVIVVQSQNGVVGNQVTVVEEQTVKTQTVGQFEALGDVPLVLESG